MDGTVSLAIEGEELLLHPDRAVLWPRRKTVIVADTHFGKSSFFARHGIAVPAGTDAGDRARLTKLVRASGAERIIILGDFLHAPIALDSQEALDLDAWARELIPARVLVVSGNHDRGAPRDFSAAIEWREDAWLEPPFHFVHEAPLRERGRLGFTLSGHIHPVIRLWGARKQRMRAPVFWRQNMGLVLPSFGAFTGGFAVRPRPGERLYVVGPTSVAAVS